jgi:hypothetical protein
MVIEQIVAPANHFAGCGGVLSCLISNGWQTRKTDY